MLGDEPLPVTSSIRNWFAWEGGRIAQSLGQALQLPNDVHYFAGSSGQTSMAHHCSNVEPLPVEDYFSISWFFVPLFVCLFLLLFFYSFLFTALSSSTTSIYGERSTEKCSEGG